VIAVALIAAFGWIMLPFLLIHHFYGWYGLTQANYVEHYGLLRRNFRMVATHFANRSIRGTPITSTRT